MTASPETLSRKEIEKAERAAQEARVGRIIGEINNCERRAAEVRASEISLNLVAEFNAGRSYQIIIVHEDPVHRGIHEILIEQSVITEDDENPLEVIGRDEFRILVPEMNGDGHTIAEHDVPLARQVICGDYENPHTVAYTTLIRED